MEHGDGYTTGVYILLLKHLKLSILYYVYFTMIKKKSKKKIRRNWAQKRTSCMIPLKRGSKTNKTNPWCWNSGEPLGEGTGREKEGGYGSFLIWRWLHRSVQSVKFIVLNTYVHPFPTKIYLTDCLLSGCKFSIYDTIFFFPHCVAFGILVP